MRNTGILFFVLLFSLCGKPLYGKDSLTVEQHDLLAMAAKYKAARSLEMHLSYKAYKDTVFGKPVDSLEEHYISYYNKVYDKKADMLSVMADSFFIFIDHTKHTMAIDRNYNWKDTNKAINRLLAYMDNFSGCRRYAVGRGSYRYRLFSDSLVYDWIDIYTHKNSGLLEKIVYRMSDINSSMEGVKLLTVEFKDQHFGKDFDLSLFRLLTYINKDGKGHGEYRDYKITNYLH